MKLEAVHLYQLKLPLEVPYKVSQKVFHEFMPIVVEVRGTDGSEGWGEALISTGYTKETIDGGWEFCRTLASKFIGKDATEVRALILSRLEQSPSAASALLSALDMLQRDAILDIKSIVRIPLLAPCQSTNLEKIPEEVEQLLEQGFRTFKVKVGFDVEADLERVGVIQEATAGRATLRLDANRAFSRQQGCDFATCLDPSGIELFEQPCASDDWDANAAVAAVSTVPVMLDESIYGIADIERASKISGIGFIKLKLKKIGSVSMLKAALEKINELGMEPVLGDGVSVEIGCWMEACVGRLTIKNAGEMNGFLKTKARLFLEPLPFNNGAIVLKPNYRPQIDRTILSKHVVRSDSFGDKRVALT